ncbi:MAG: hypothetical protein VXZ72_02345 [Chlamydiota bacterium]|nr:hypothetical protein [Chlamydiota bacterium]
MFYEKLAQAKQEKKRRNLRDKLLIGAGAAAGGVGGYKAVDNHVKDYMMGKELDARVSTLMDRIKLVDRFDADPSFSFDDLTKAKKRLLDIEAKKIRRAKLLGRGMQGGATLLGAGALGYGTKKLLDRYNKKKRD